MRLLLVLNDAHNPINNPTVQIADPGKQNTFATKLHNQCACHLTHRWRCMFLSPWHTVLAIYSSWNYGRSLVLSDLPNITRLISLHYVFTLCCFRLTTVFENCHSDTLHNISRPKFAIVFQNGTCEIGFMTRFSQQRCRCVTVRWEFGLLNWVHVRWLRCQIKLSRVGILPLWNWSAFV